MSPLLAFLATFFLIISLSSCTGSGIPRVRLYILTLQWPNSFCITNWNKCVCTPVLEHQKFTVHGLWPALWDGTSVTNCGRRHSEFPNHFPKNAQHIWPSFTRRSNVDFWKYQWEKHGSCSHLTFTQYFEDAVKLGNQRSKDVKRALEQEGIRPSASDRNIQEFRRALKRRFRQKVLIRCKTDRDPDRDPDPDPTNRRDLYLLEIGLCYDLRFHPVDCPEEFEGCGMTRAHSQNINLIYPDESQLRFKCRGDRDEI